MSTIKKNEFSGLDENNKKRYQKKLLQLFENEKPYLDPSLQLADLAKRMSIPMRYMSQIINEQFNINFYDFINQYRIQESKQFLINGNTEKKTILEILYQSGFNSKSVFNTAFKKHTGKTPSEFKQSYHFSN